MKLPAIPQTEAARLRALQALRLHETGPEGRFDRLTRMGARMFKVSISTVTLVDEDRQWFKSCFGMNISETSRDVSFCAHAILSGEPFIIPDATLDDRFHDNPLVVGPPYIRFYAGIPLATRENHLVGTLCLIDHRPRTFGPEEIELFQLLASLARDEINYLDRRMLEDELLKKTAFLEGLVNSPLDGVFVVDHDGQRLLQNRRMTELWKIPPHLSENPDITVQRAWLASMTTEPEKFFQVVTHMYADPIEVLRDEVELKDGTTLDRFSSPVIGANGFNYGRIWTFRDITDKKRAISEMQRAAKAAELADRTKSEFISNMNHEIRTPLNGIVTMTDLMLGTDLTDEQRDFVQTTHEAAQHLMAIISDVLDFSKLGVEGIGLETHAFDLQGLVRDIESILSSQALKKGLNLSCEIVPGLARTYLGDATRLRQVLINLVSNAIKFTETGEVTLLVSLSERRSDYPDKANLVFSVVDTGTGIAPERLESIFKPFSQVDMSTTRRHGGVGLGLAISQKIVALMGGALTAESVPGAGSTFRFEILLPIYLPTGRADQRAVIASTRRLGTGVHAPEVNSFNILMVEDNSTNQKILAQVLKRIGHKADVANNGKEGVEAAKNKDYDLILMDLHMPEMDGFEATKQIRAILPPRDKRPTIIALTADVQKGTVEKCLEAGMDSYTTKPVKIDVLQVAIGQLLQSHQAEKKDSSPK